MKKAQITTFVLLGLVILVVLLLLALLVSRSWSNRLTNDEAELVRSTIELCTESTLEQQLRAAGTTGGLLNTAQLQRHLYSWESDVVTLPGQEIPYWSHLRTCPQSDIGCETTHQPALCSRTPCPGPINPQFSIQEQMEQEFPTLLVNCLQNFSTIDEYYVVEPLRSPRAEILIGYGSVRAEVDYPVDVTAADGRSIRIDNFIGVADVDLAQIYQTAQNITDAQRRYGFIEDRTMHLIAIYSGVGEAIPPMRDVQVLGGKSFWSRTQVEETLQYDVLPWINFLQLSNSLDTYRPIMVPEIDDLTPEELSLYRGVFDHLTVTLNNQSLDGIEVQFFYPYTRPYLSINDGQEILKARGVGGGFLSAITGVFVNDYRFRYDLSFPVVVTLRDPDAFDGRGYDFTFALEANVRDNAAVDRNATADSLFLAGGADIASLEQHVEALHTIIATDAVTNNLLPLVRVSYQCGEEFYIGETDSAGQLQTTLPYCEFGGIILYSRPGYLGSGKEFDNPESSPPTEITLELEPLHEVTVKILKRTEQDIALLPLPVTTQQLRTQASPLRESEMAMVNFYRVGSEFDDENPIPPFFVINQLNQTLVVDPLMPQMADNLTRSNILTQATVNDINNAAGAINVSKADTVTLKLVPGTYTIDAFVMHNEPFTIPEDTIGIWPFSKKIEAATFSSWLTGGAKLNFTITREDLEKSNLTLYLLTQDPPRSWQQLEDYSGPEQFQQGREDLIQPLWS